MMTGDLGRRKSQRQRQRKMRPMMVRMMTAVECCSQKVGGRRSCGGRRGGMSSGRELVGAAETVQSPESKVQSPQRNPKAEIRRPKEIRRPRLRPTSARQAKSEIRNKNGKVIRRKRQGLDRLAARYRSCEREGNIPRRES